jgi:hypothetical protein
MATYLEPFIGLGSKRGGGGEIINQTSHSGKNYSNPTTFPINCKTNKFRDVLLHLYNNDPNMEYSQNSRALRRMTPGLARRLP